MTKSSLYGPLALSSLWLSVAVFGCAKETDGDMDARGLTTAGASAPSAAGAAGFGPTTVFAGSSAIDAAGRGGPSAGSAGVQSVAGRGASDGPRSTGGAGASGSAGSRGEGRAGTGAAGSGGAPAAGSGAAGAAAAGAGARWMPKPGVTWQWQLTGALDTNVDAQMFDIDLFTTSAATIEKLHAAGKIVVCYFSGGSYEPGRPDSDALSRTGLGKTLDGWPDEKWLDIRSPAVRDLMKARLDVAKVKGCDGVEPDNVDGYDNDNGFGLTEKDAIDYDRFLATESHARGLSIGLKNSLGIASMLVSSFDWALNEECLQYDECETLEPFIAAGKAVFHCEYGMNTNSICGKAPKGFSTIVKNLDLDAFRLTCN